MSGQKCLIGVTSVARRVLAGAAIAAVLGVAVSCRPSVEPTLFRAEPSVVVQGTEVTVKLRGQHLLNASRIDLDSQRAAETSQAWSVEIGDLWLGPENVQLVDTETLLVIVPGTLTLGVHDVVVTTSTGAHPTLHNGLTVMAEGDATLDTGIGETATSIAAPSQTGSRDAGSDYPTRSSDSASERTSLESSSVPDGAVTGKGETIAADTGDVTSANSAASSGSLQEDAGGLALEELRGALVHRYSFEEVGAVVLDSVSGADGMFVGASLDGSGEATFTGGGEYVDLPNALISGRDAVTIEVWLIWDVPNSAEAYSWRRIFDFGSNSALEGQQGAQDTHLFLSPRSGGADGALHLAYRGNLTGSVTLNAGAPLTPGIVEHLAAVVDGVGGRMELYVEGASVAARDLGFGLSLIDDHNNWIGRSQVIEDPAFQGRILEFRIYDGVVSAQSLSASHAAGPDVSL